MDPQADSNKITFLRGTWRALLHDQPEPFDKRLLADFVAGDVLESLPSRTTLKHVLHECHARSAFHESYIKSFLGLRKTWDQLTPESRHIIMQYASKCGLHKQGGSRLQALPDDEAALTIRWDIANRLYSQARDAAFKECRALGLEMTQPRGLPRANEFALLVHRGQEILIALLRERLNIDKTAVTMAVGHVTPVARTKLTLNLADAGNECREAFQAALFHWALHHPGALVQDATPATLTPAQERTLREYAQECLQPFEKRLSALLNDADHMSSEPTLYEKVRRQFSEGATLH